MIPTREECLYLMAQCRMLSHIKEHSFTVARVALFLSEELNKKGQRIDLKLVEAASLLHDIAKTECLVSKKDHAETGFQLLAAKGYERVGGVVAHHVRLPRGGDPSRVTETEVVNYADKRVRHDQIVSVEERFADLITRYGTNEKAVEFLQEMREKTSEIERKIFSILVLDPKILETPRES
jgi:uncharacterized protein